MLPADVAGKTAATVWILASLLALFAELAAPAPGPYGRTGSWLIVGLSLLAGTLIWFLPWGQWPRSSSLWLVPLAFATIGLNFRIGGGSPFIYALTFMMVFAWLGVAHRRGTSLCFAPLLIVAYCVPLLGGTTRQAALGMASAIYAVPTCVLVGEVVAWGIALLGRSEAALTEARESYAAAFEQSPIGIGLASTEGEILRVNRAYGTIVGFPPEALQGRYLGDMTHPDDSADTTAKIRALVSGSIDDYQLEKRYLHADGHEVWVSVNGSCARDQSGAPLYVIIQVEDVTERRALREQLAFAAVHDQLTGLPNRAMFMDRLVRSLIRAEEDGRHVALMFIDLDRFKMVNDGLGHDAGDRLLQRVAQRLQEAMRVTDLLARFGGDEFTALCEVADEDEALRIADRLRLSMEQPLSEAGNEQFVSLSIGIALSTPDLATPSALLRRADMAMYQAKGGGPSRVCVYDEQDGLQTMRSLETTNELHRALERSEFELYFQPFVDLRDGTMVGLESLVRWNHPARGLLLPDQFIPLAEECGIIVPLGNWVMREACRQGAVWADRRTREGLSMRRLNLSFNVAAQQLAEPLFVRWLAEALDDSGFPADNLWLEITEGTIVRDPEAVVAALGDIRELGAHIAIDDFGTGYSSLSYLKQLPVEILKIDQSFVDEVDTDPDDVAIVRAVIALGESLGVAVIAEGIERPSQADQLGVLGCRVGQGFLYGRPTAAARIGAFPADDLTLWPAESSLTRA